MNINSETALRIQKVEWGNGNCILCNKEAELADGYCVTCWDTLTLPGEGYTRELKLPKKYRKTAKKRGGYEKLH